MRSRRGKPRLGALSGLHLQFCLTPGSTSGWDRKRHSSFSQDTSSNIHSVSITFSYSFLFSPILPFQRRISIAYFSGASLERSSCAAHLLGREPFFCNISIGSSTSSAHSSSSPESRCSRKRKPPSIQKITRSSSCFDG